MTAPQMMAACPKVKDSCRTCGHGKEHEKNDGCLVISAAQDCPACTPLPAEPEKSCETAECPDCGRQGMDCPEYTEPERSAAESRCVDWARKWDLAQKGREAAERVIDQDARVIEGLREELEAANKARDEWAATSRAWAAAADEAQQEPAFYLGYSEATMRAMQALITRQRKRAEVAEMAAALAGNAECCSWTDGILVESCAHLLAAIDEFMAKRKAALDTTSKPL